jgi:hypothetical protein
MDVLGELDAALQERNAALEEILGKAQNELEACRARCSELERAIARTRALINPQDATRPLPVGPARITLHEAMRQVLSEAGNEGLTGRELVDTINSRGLYRQRAGTPVTINQVHARARNYEHMFARREGRFVLAGKRE